MLTIGRLAKQSDVKIPTIRYYESIGIIEPPERSEGNQRRYSNSALEQLTFVKHARNLGFPIDAIRSLLKLSQHTETHCQNADQIAKVQLTEVQQRIKKLKALEKELQRITNNCDGNTIDSCYVIQSLSDHTLCNSEH